MIINITYLSDTHNLHSKVKMDDKPPDILMYGGDMSGIGEQWQVERFFKWWQDQQSLYKVLIAGNHDKSFVDKPEWLVDILNNYINENNFYLENSSCNIWGLNIWGSPYSKWFHGYRWAFNVHEKDAHDIYSKIPVNTDIILSHGPTYCRLDKTVTEEFVGSEILGYYVRKIKPKLFLCGHIHEAYGMEEDFHTKYYNGSILNHFYDAGNDPWQIKLDI